MQIRKSRKQAAPPARAARAPAKKQLAWAVGAEKFQHRDPLYHVTEDFHQTFDRIGRKHAHEMIGGLAAEGIREAEEQKHGEQSAHRSSERKEPKQPGQAAGHTVYDPGKKRMWRGNVPDVLTDFSATAFQRGQMSGSVLNGTGKMMLVSCLKRTVGQSGPKRAQQQTLLGTGSQVRNLPGGGSDQMVFNRGVANGALGIVVDTIRDARRVVDSMTKMAQGAGELKEKDGGTMRAMYPFLDASREEQLEAQYRASLASCTDEREKAVLQNALTQVLELKDKKAQMKKEFINKLRFISDRATETLADLEAPGTLDEIVASVWGDMDQEAAAGDAGNGADGGGEGAEDGAPDGSEGGAGTEDLTGGEGPAAGEAKPESTAT